MKKKYIVLIGILIFIVLLGGVVFVLWNKSTQGDEQTQLTLKFSDLQAHYPSDPASCLTTNDDPNLTLNTSDQAGIESAAFGTVIDIPAGTSGNVHIKTYDKTSATGTLLFESTYGNYNFTAKKADANTNQESWVVTTFVACKK